MKVYWCLLFLAITFYSCKPVESSTEKIHIFTGETMGTYYNIRYVSNSELVDKAELDSLLEELNQQVSTYIKDSDISLLNQSDKENLAYAKNVSSHFIKNYSISKEIYNISSGYFDPTLNPLVNFWGFGYDKKSYEDKDLTKIPEIMQSIGFSKWNENWKNSDTFTIQKPLNASLDFSAVAKGYGVDIVGDFVESQGIDNYFVDIGGEATGEGIKPDGSVWLVGINTPTENASVTDAKAYVKLEDRSIATSGNYRNYYEEDGVKYSHTINPFTGYSERSNLLSSSIVHKDCSKADAMATACMVLGLEKSYRLIESLPDYEALFIYTSEGQMKIKKTGGFTFEVE